jgi:hypothetical protein
LKNLDRRNDLEHHEERMDRWFPRNMTVDMLISRKDAQIVLGMGLDGFDRHFDPFTTDFSIRGQTVNLQAICDELSIIHERAEKLRFSSLRRAPDR